MKNFYAHASREYIEDFEKYVRSGEIGLSGNYLNMTELISSDVLDTRLEQARQYGERIGHPVISAMTADVNGYAWGYADALYNHGIRHLYSCVHTHHGMFPLYKKTMPFYWEGPGGNRVLVWNGEHYHYGNELFLAPHGGTSYLTHDEFHRPCLEGDILRTSAGETEKEEMKIATCRIERFLENLEEEGYPYDLVPLMVSGVITDNAPPSAEIARRLKDLNVYYDGQIRFRMVTLEQFFEQVEKRCQDIPVYSGDWNDWWTDGVGSTPAAVKIFRDARRKYDLCRKLDPQGTMGEEALMDQAAEDLGKPAVLHTKGQERRIGEMIRGFKGKLCVHWYSGSLEDLKGFLEQDCYFTLGPDTAALAGGKLGAAREEEGKVRRRLLEQVPASRLFVETDGIGAVAWAFGEEKAEADRVPLALRENMECAAAWKKMSVWQMADRMEKNLKEFLSPKRSESEKETV